MKGFIEVYDGRNYILLNIQHIVSVKPHRDEERCYITTMEVKNGAADTFSVFHSYHQVKSLIESAQK